MYFLLKCPCNWGVLVIFFFLLLFVCLFVFFDFVISFFLFVLKWSSFFSSVFDDSAIDGRRYLN